MNGFDDSDGFLSTAAAVALLVVALAVFEFAKGGHKHVGAPPEPPRVDRRWIPIDDPALRAYVEGGELNAVTVCQCGEVLQEARLALGPCAECLAAGGGR